MAFSCSRARLPLGAAVIDQFLGLRPHPKKCQATYIWIDGTGENIRTKTRTIDPIPLNINEYPIWNYDGSSCGQSHGLNSDLYLKPVAHYPDPFHGGQNCLVLCETLNHLNEPTKTNNRAKCKTIMDKIADQKPWFGMEQEYLLLDSDLYPLGWPKKGYPSEDNYCSPDAIGEKVAKLHLEFCQTAKLDVNGFEAGSVTGSWKFHLGPIEGIGACDQLITARFILRKVVQNFSLGVLMESKPNLQMGYWNGAGCHTNFSTAAMRAENGLAVIEAAMPKLAAKHGEHFLGGFFKTNIYIQSSEGVANLSPFVRIRRQVAAEKKFYLEDRRPSSNCDPYAVTAAIAGAICL